MKNFTSLNVETEIPERYEIFETDVIEKKEKEKLTFSKLHKICCIFIFFVMFSLSLTFYLFPNAKHRFFNFFTNVSEYGLVGYLIFILIGCSMILTGVPFLIFELYTPFVLKTYFLSILIVFTTKIFGVSLSFWISRNLLRRKMENLLFKNKIFHTIQIIYQENPSKCLLMVSLFFIPFFIKNYGVPLLNISFFKFSLIYTSSQLALSLWFINIGINAKEYVELENDNRNVLNFVIFGIFSILIMIMIFLYMRKTMKKYSNDEKK